MDRKDIVTMNETRGPAWLRSSKRRVFFDREKCIACELCLPVCPYNVMEIVF